MPALTFFSLLPVIQRSRAKEKIDLCDIQAISICHSEYYKTVRGDFKDIYNAFDRSAKDTYQSPDPVFMAPSKPLEGSDAQNSLIDLFQHAKRFL